MGVGLLSIPAAVRGSAARHGDLDALVDPSRGLRLSFRELDEQVVGSVRAAVAAGIAPGDRVAIWAPNSPEWIVAALGVLGAGAVLVPLNTRYRGAEAADIVARSGATTLITVAGFLGHDYVGMLRGAAPDCPALHRVVVLDGDGPTGWAGHLAAGASVPVQVAERRIAAVAPDDLSDIMYTSGTTGAPKGVMLTHGQSLRAFGWLGELLTFRPGDRNLVIPPFFHTFGYKAGWLASLVHGVAVVPIAVFDAAAVLRLVAAERITILCGPPTVYTDLLAGLEKAGTDLSSLRVAMPAATRVPVELIRRLRDELRFEVVVTSYGLTEATSLVSTCTPDDLPETVATTVGRPAPGVEVRIADAGVGEPGEVLVRGFGVMRGYWRDPVATASVIDVDGWLHTGDVGTLDARGYLRIVDRAKDMLVTGGFNVYPAEVERVMLGHPLVAEVAVVGVPDGRLGEVAVAFVVPDPDGAPDPAELLVWTRERLANFKVPRRIELIGELPRNASTKVAKPALRALLDTDQARPANAAISSGP